MNRRLFLALPLASRAASQQLLKRVLDNLSAIETVDTHEHLLAEDERVRQKVDFFTLASHYAIDDAYSAGLNRTEFEKAPEFEDKWRLFEPVWPRIRNTGYARALQIAVADIYGTPEIDRATMPRLNAAIAAKNKPGLYRDILKRRARLRFAVNDLYWQPKPAPVDPEFFVLAQKFDGLVAPITRQGVQRLEALTESSITSLDGLKRALESHFGKALEAGMVTVKSTLAYQRELRYERVSAADAQREFEQLMRNEGKTQDAFQDRERRPHKPLADHMFHHLVQLAAVHGIPMQIHTGLTAGNGGFIEHTRPSLLSNLFHLYPGVKFDLFHIGYPYHHEVAVLAKQFPNVYADFCWMHIVAPVAARAALHEMLDAVPANKIFGYGGDYRYPELSYGHLVLARRNIATVLAERVEAGASTEHEAQQIGRWLMHDNPAALFSPRKRV